MSGVVTSTALLAGAATRWPALAQTPITISGGFDVGPGGEQGNFNPMAATAGFTWLAMYFEPLVIYDDKLENIIGALAERFEISADQTAYTLHLAAAKWHDGQDFTAADVSFSFGLSRDGATGSVLSGRLAAISSVETPDDHTVVLRLSAPNAAFMDTLTRVMMLPQHALSAIPRADLARNAWWSTTPIGTGPFRFTRYVSGQFVELAANAAYRGGKPHVDRVVNRYFDNTAGAVSALRAGEIQFSYVETDDVVNFRTDPKFRVLEGGSFVVNYLGFNQLVPLWHDVRVRQAVMHAIDRPSIISSLYGGAAELANCGYVESNIVPGNINPYAYDPQKAQALLDAAGWSRINGDKPITLLTYYNTPLAGNVLAAIQAMLAQVGINVVPRTVDVPTYNSVVYAATPDPAAFAMTYAGWQDGPDPSTLNDGLNETRVPPAGANIMRIRMPPLTSALNAALAETDNARRTERYRDVCRAMNANLPWGTLWVTKRFGIASRRLDNFVWLPAPSGGPYQAHAERWTLNG